MLASEDLTPEEQILRDEGNRKVRQAMSTMKEQKQLLLAMDAVGYTYEEMATTLEVPLGTVKSSLNRARTQLGKKLINEGME